MSGVAPVLRRVAAALIAGVFIVAGTAGFTGPCAGDPQPSKFQPGAAGIGDPYFPTYGNGGYDVAHYDLTIRYDPADDTLTGTATITATATANLSRFNLDLAGLTVSSVQVNSAPATFDRDGAELMITPADGLPSGTAFTVAVAYHGVPQPIPTLGALGQGGFTHTADGAFALGEPESASTWFPVNDHPLDKATYDIAITVPDGLTALSNGVPGATTTADGWTTWTWSESSPMASYLATVVIGNYRVTTSTHNGKPLITAVAASLPDEQIGYAEAAMARTGEIADFLETQFGPYPFDSYGGIVVNDDRFEDALETQSRPVYGASFFMAGPSTGVLAHELAHQWFGNSISVHHWRDTWLAEGFATYAGWLWRDHEDFAPAQTLFTDAYNDTDWSKPAIPTGPATVLASEVNQRGAMTLHALRLTVGDDTFFRILQTWTAAKRNGNAATADFITHAEAIAGRPLQPLFDAWLTGPTPPPLP